MNIQKKTEEKPQQKVQTSQVSVSYNRSAYQIDTHKQLPVGKHKGATVEYILKHEKSYADWMEKEDLFHKWGLIKLKNTPVKTNKPKWDQMRTDSGEIWLGIRIEPTGISNHVRVENLPW